jgi:hypothetical protein
MSQIPAVVPVVAKTGRLTRKPSGSSARFATLLCRNGALSQSRLNVHYPTLSIGIILRTRWRIQPGINCGRRIQAPKGRDTTAQANEAVDVFLQWQKHFAQRRRGAEIRNQQLFCFFSVSESLRLRARRSFAFRNKFTPSRALGNDFSPLIGWCTASRGYMICSHSATGTPRRLVTCRR